MLILIKYNTNTLIVWLLTVYYSTFQVLVNVIVYLTQKHAESHHNYQSLKVPLQRIFQPLFWLS